MALPFISLVLFVTKFRHLLLFSIFCPSVLIGQNILLNNTLTNLDSRGPLGCPTWRVGFDTGQSQFVAEWYSPSDTINIPANYMNNGWAIHDCQAKWNIDPNSAKPCNYPFPCPVNGIGYGQVTLKTGFTKRGFISQQLQKPLEADIIYCAEFYTRPF